MRVRFAPQAEQQYLTALGHIFSRSPAGAETVQRRAEAVVALLREHPDSGHRIPEFPELPYREIPVPPYRFFYRVVDDELWIIGVWHARQLPESPADTSHV